MEGHLLGYTSLRISDGNLRVWSAKALLLDLFMLVSGAVRKKALDTCGHL